MTILLFIFGALGGLFCFLNEANAQVVPHIPLPQVHVVVPKIHVSPPQVHVVPPRLHVATPQVHLAVPQVHLNSPHVLVPTPHIERPQIATPHIHLPASRLAGGGAQPVHSPSTGPKASEPNLAASSAMHKGKNIDPVLRHVERGNLLTGKSTEKNSAGSQPSVAKSGMSPATAACGDYVGGSCGGGWGVTPTTGGGGKPQHTVPASPTNPMWNPEASDNGANMGSGSKAPSIVPHPQLPPKAPSPPAPTPVNNPAPPPAYNPPAPTPSTTPVHDPAPPPVSSPAPTLVNNSPAPTPPAVNTPSAPPQVAAPTPPVAAASPVPSQPAMPVPTNADAGSPSNSLTPPNISGTVATLLNPPPLNGGYHDPSSSASEQSDDGSSSLSWGNASSWGNTSDASLASSPIFTFVSNNPGSAALIGTGFLVAVASGGVGLPAVIGAALMGGGLFKAGSSYVNSGAATAPIANFK